MLESLEDRTLLSASPVSAGLPDLSSLQAPLLGYSALMGSSGGDSAHGLAVDSSGNTYIVGDTNSSDFPGAKQTYAGSGDGFVSKLSPSGELLWTALLGGSSNDSATSVALDDSGNLYVTGYTFSPDFPESGQNNTAGKHAFVSKLNSDGQLLWSKLLGNSASGWSIAAASTGVIYVTGSTEDHSFPGTVQANAGFADGFVSKLNSSGELLWSVLIGGSGDDSANSIAVDTSDNAYITGFTSSHTFSGTKQVNAGDYDAFVSKLSSDGELLWSTLIGGSGSDFAYGIALDASSNAYITGTASSHAFPGTKQANAGGHDGFASKLNSDGELLWSTLIGGNGDDFANSIALDTSGNAYITGYTSSNTLSGTKQANAGGYDAFVSKLNSSGELLWSLLLGGDNFDLGAGIAVDPSSNIYVAGTTASSNFPGPNGTTLPPASGNSDAFVVKLTDQAVPTATVTVGLSGIGVIHSSDGSYSLASGTVYSVIAHVSGTGGVDLGTPTLTYYPGTDTSGDGFDTAPTVPGTYTVVASYAGNEDYLSASARVTFTITAGQLPTQIHFYGLDYNDATNSYTHTYVNGVPQVALASVVGEDIGTPAASLSYYKGSYASVEDLNAAIAANTAVSLSGAPAETGSYTVLATYAGDSVYAPAFAVAAINIVNPAPILTDLRETSIPIGGAPFTLFLNGSGFTPHSVVQWNGTELTTTYVNSTQLYVSVPDAYLSHGGSFDITVINPAPGGGISNPLTFTGTQAPPKEEPTNPGTPLSATGASAAQEWNSYSGLYHLLTYQYFSNLGLDSFSSFTWGGIFTQFNVNLGILKGASPLASLILFNHFLSQGGDPYLSGIVATSLTGQGSSFTPVSGSPSERADAYYQSLGLTLDSLTDLYAHALSLGHPDDAIVALIAVQHGVPLA